MIRTAIARTLLTTIAVLTLVAGVGHAQTSDSLYRALVERSLATFDLPSFEWAGAPDPMRPRLGFYLNKIPADSLLLIPGLAGAKSAYRIWHVMPHWSADEAGLLIDDIVTAFNDKPLNDTTYEGEEYLNAMVRDMKGGEVARFTVLRGGKPSEIRVSLLAAERVEMPVKPIDVLGPIRTDTWLQRTTVPKDLAERAVTIQKQMRVICDQDFSTVRFAGRPNPWRLDLVTYLHHNPTRLGAVARNLDNELWNMMVNRSGLRGVIARASTMLSIGQWRPAGQGRRRPHEEVTLQDYQRELDSTFLAAQRLLDEAYAPVRGRLDSITVGLVRLLDMEHNWEEELDSTKEPVRRRDLRNAYEKRLGTLFADVDKVNMTQVARAAWFMADYADSAWVHKFVHAFEAAGKMEPKHVSGVEGDVLLSWSSLEGPCVIGGKGPNRYTGNFAFIIDLGGDDIYDLPSAPLARVRYVADVSGNDIYRSKKHGQGAGVGCIDMLVDLDGDDYYRGVSYSQGSAALGIGLLADYAGDDHYSAHWCSQGAAFHGIGLLYDGGGFDSYGADVYSQGFGYIRGFGAILERGGNDQYRAGWKYPDSRYPNRAHLAMSQGFGFGMRPWSTGIGADGGIGLLSDQQGDDLYASDYFSQGGSYWYALGILHDAQGADRYTAGQYSQGSGIHLSFGALLDDAGDDMYDAYAGLEQGNAHDWSSGCLEDAGGNDTYRGSGSSQGSALTVSFAWLLDLGGDDRYYAHLGDTTNSQGGGNANRVRRSGSMGMLLDLGGGDDYYVEPRATAGVPLIKGNGILYDDGPRKTEAAKKP